MKFRILVPLLAFFLVSCGGGAPGDESKPPTSEVPRTSLTLRSGSYAMTFTPGKVAASTEQGWDASVDVEVEATGAYDTQAYVAVSDPDQVTSGYVPVRSLGNGRYAAVVTLNPRLPVGRHTGDLQLIVCKSYYCDEFYLGSPWKIPYDFTVTASTAQSNLPLRAIAGAQNWTTYQGSASHTGYVPLQVTRFERRWNWNVPSTNSSWRLYNGLNSVATYDGVVYLSTRKGISSAGFSNFVYALSEDTGQEIWRRDLGDLYDTSPPAVTANHVFVASSGHQDTAMWQLDRLSGQVLQRSPFDSQWQRYVAPTVHADGVYNTSGSNGGLTKWATATGAKSWTTMWTDVDLWTPAVNDQFVLGFSHQAICCYGGARLNALDPHDGTMLFSIEDFDAGDIAPFSSPLAPVLTSASTVVVTSGQSWFGTNRLVRFDLASRSVTWRVKGYFPGNPVFANGVVYIAQSAPFRVEARRESDGLLLWTWKDPVSAPAPTNSYNGGLDPIPTGSMAITDSHVFVSSTRAVHAIDLQSHQSVWSYPRAGEIAISAKGVLYISTLSGSEYPLSDGRVVAITLH